MTQRGRGVLLCLLAGTLWSTGGVLVRTLEEAGVWQISFYRSGLVALVVLGLVQARYGASTLRAFREIGWPGVIGALLIAGSNICFIIAISATTVANTMFMLAAEPLVAALLARLVLGERVGAATWVAMTVAGAGIAVMVGDSLVGGQLVGALVALLGSSCFAGFAVCAREGRGRDMLPAVALGGATVAAVAALASGGALGVSGFDFAIIAVLGIVQAAFGLIAFVAGSRHLPAAPLVLLSLIEVVLAPIWVLIAYDEVPSALSLVGGGMILASVVGLGLVSARAGTR